MTFLEGYKTYIVSAVLLVIALLKVFGIVIPGFETIDIGQQIAIAIGLFTARLGSKQDVAKS